MHHLYKTVLYNARPILGGQAFRGEPFDFFAGGGGGGGVGRFLRARMFLLTDQQGHILFSHKTAEKLFGGRLSPAGFFFHSKQLNQWILCWFNSVASQR